MICKAFDKNQISLKSFDNMSNFKSDSFESLNSNLENVMILGKKKFSKNNEDE